MSHLTPRPADHHPYDLTIRRLFEAPVLDDPGQEIVYRGKVRLTYREFRERVHRLAGALAALGVKPGDTVAVMDYDSHRYLEAFFAVPMMGAVLHTDNVGSAAYNKDLSQRRAQSVVNALVKRGIAPEKLLPVGYGFDRPVAKNDTAMGRALNRRVEFTILKEGEGAEK